MSEKRRAVVSQWVRVSTAIAVASLMGCHGADDEEAAHALALLADATVADGGAMPPDHAHATDAAASSDAATELTGPAEPTPDAATEPTEPTPDAATEPTDPAANSDAATDPAAVGDAATEPTEPTPDAATEPTGPTEPTPDAATEPTAPAANSDAATDPAAVGDAATEPTEPTPDAATAPPHQHPDEDAGVDPDAAPEPVDPALEHCTMHEPVADPRDATLDPTPVIVAVRRSQDVLLPQPIIDWMAEQAWDTSHHAWHTTRTWDARCGSSFAPAEGCTYASNLVAEGLWRSEFQQGAPGSGLAFLAMHRHMIQMFKAAFPSHGELFRGFTHIPRSIEDPENPTPWRAPTWAADDLAGFDILENIEQHVDMFATDDELGLFIETNVRWSLEDPSARFDIVGAGVHGALHREWTVFGSPGNLGGTDTSLRNYTFWKLHGWIDDVWTRYRAAKGLPDTEPSYQAVALSECILMYYLSPEHRAAAPDDVRN